LREAAKQQILERIGDDDLVLDIGGWADPLERADWILDAGDYDSRGLYARAGWKESGAAQPAERFTRETWVQRDICDRAPFPFDDEQFDFVVCSHTLEDVRDPIWVCSEINRIAKAGYIEVPSRLEEQSWGVDGDFVGHHHHHWLIEEAGGGLEFTFKSHDIHGSPGMYFPTEFWKSLSDDERVVRLWWEGSFEYRERMLFFEADAGDIADFVTRELERRGMTLHSEAPLRRLAKRALRRGA
jgi:hypothetical protein